MADNQTRNGQREATGDDLAASGFEALSVLVRSVRPETTEHLYRAAKEMLLAIRGVIDGLTDQLDAMEARSAADRIERIPVRRR